MSDPRTVPDGPYDPQPATNPIPTSPVLPGHGPLEVPPAPSTEPIGVPATDPDRGPSIPSEPGPSIPSDPQPRA